MAIEDPIDRIKELYHLDDREVQDFALQYVYDFGEEEALADFIEDELGDPPATDKD